MEDEGGKMLRLNERFIATVEEDSVSDPPFPPPPDFTPPADSRIDLTEPEQIKNPEVKSAEYRLMQAKAAHLDHMRTEHREGRPSVTLSFKNLSFVVNGNNRILHNCNGVFKAGELTALMGPSGAGKSTLLNVLAGYRTRQSEGRVLVNNKDRFLPTFRKIAAYVMQDDVLMKNLTVKEYLMVSAELRLPQGMNSHEKLLVVKETMNSFGLQKCADVATGSLSGGQRKRLSVALELINDPPVLFLDEPTSGLDSTTSFSVTKMLRQLADSGRTVICTIHQPSATLFEMFHQVYVLAGGEAIYGGPVNEIVPYFNELNLPCPIHHNPADFLLEVANGLKGDITQIKVHFKQLNKYAALLPSGDSAVDGGQDIGDVHRGEYVTTMAHQFKILYLRSIREILRDKLMTKLRFVAHVAGGVLIGLLYLNQGVKDDHVHNILGYFFFSILFLMLASIMPTVLTFPVEKEIFSREHLNNWYRVKAYYYAKSLCDFPFQILFPSIYCVITYFMLGLPNDATRFFKIWFIYVLHTQVAQSIGVVIGAAAPTMQVAVFLAPMTAVPMMLFSGFFIILSQIKPFLRWLQYLSYFRYSFEALCLALFEDLDLKCHGPTNPDGTCPISKEAQYRNGNAVLDYFGYTTGFSKYGYQVLLLCIFFVIARIVAYIILRVKAKRAY